MFRVLRGRGQLRANDCRGELVRGVAGKHWVDEARSRGLSGAAPKVFLRLADGRAYIAKRPTKQHVGARECIMEHLIARLGAVLPVRFTRSRVARLALPEAEGVHFLSEFFLKPSEQLLHGVEAFALALDTNKEAVFDEVHTGAGAEQEFYTLSMVKEVLMEVAWPRQTGAALVESFARMIAFDALLGVQDRHAQNWGIVHDTITKTRRFAPLFDSARGLYLRIDDAKLEKHRSSRPFMCDYAARATPLVGTGDGPCNHFGLFKAMLNAYDPPAVHSALRVVESATRDRVRSVLRSFDPLLSSTRLEMIDDLVACRRATLHQMAADAR